MKKNIVALLLFWLALSVRAQGIIPAYKSVDYFRSGVLTGSERDRYYSLRVYALGLGFQGLIEDQLTDLYRNPAYFAKNDKKLLWGDVVHKTMDSKMISSTGNGSTIYSYPIYYAYNDNSDDLVIDDYPYTSSSLLRYYGPSPLVTNTGTGLHFGYAGNFGILARGNHSTRISEINSDLYGVSSSYSFSRLKEDEHSTQDNNGGDIQFSYGLPFSESVTFGISYTLAYNELPGDNSYNDLEIAQRDGISSTDSSWEINQQNSQIARRVNIHILKAGLLYEADSTLFEAVATAELSSSDYGYTDLQSRSYAYDYYYDYYSGTASYDEHSHSQTDGQATANDAFSSSITNIKVGLRYLKTSLSHKTFSATFDVGVNSFSANEKANSMNYSHSYYYRFYSPNDIYTNENINSSRYVLQAQPDGNGFFIRGAVAWGFFIKDYYLLIGANSYGTENSFDYDNVQSYSSQSSQIYQDSIYSNTNAHNASAYHHKYTLSTIQVALPIGVEYELVKDCFIRAGWELTYLRKVEKDASVEMGHRNVSETINTSHVTFGGGFHLTDDLWADFVSSGNFTEPANWTLQIVYHL